jgi:hypothetical protein
MEFGIGPVEFLVLLVVFLGIPLGIVFLLVRAGMRYLKTSKAEKESLQLSDELDTAQLRLEDLEGKLSRVEDQARFTESLLETRERRE